MACWSVRNGREAWLYHDVQSIVSANTDKATPAKGVASLDRNAMSANS
jgi:hypothetical protein